MASECSYSPPVSLVFHCLQIMRTLHLGFHKFARLESLAVKNFLLCGEWSLEFWNFVCLSFASRFTVSELCFFPMQTTETPT